MEYDEYKIRLAENSMVGGIIVDVREPGQKDAKKQWFYPLQNHNPDFALKVREYLLDKEVPVKIIDTFLKNPSLKKYGTA